jgi:hypothetical protein
MELGALVFLLCGFHITQPFGPGNRQVANPMSATVSIAFLQRVRQATPEQRAVIERILRGAPGEPVGGDSRGDQNGQAEDADAQLDALVRIERKLDVVLAWIAEARVEPEIRVGEHEAKRVFLLMQRLESGPKERKASLATVFRLLVLKGLSQRAVASRCGCVESLISARVATIESTFGLTIERLRNFASELVSLEAAAKGDRRRKRKSSLSDDFECRERAEEDGTCGEQRFGDREEDADR